MGAAAREGPADALPSSAVQVDLSEEAAEAWRGGIKTPQEKPSLGDIWSSSLGQLPQANWQRGGLQRPCWHLAPVSLTKDKGGHCKATPDAEGCHRAASSGGVSGSADPTWACQSSLWIQAI